MAQKRVAERETVCVRCGIRLRSRAPVPVCLDCKSDAWFMERIGLSFPVPAQRRESA